MYFRIMESWGTFGRHTRTHWPKFWDLKICKFPTKMNRWHKISGWFGIASSCCSCKVFRSLGKATWLNWNSEGNSCFLLSLYLQLNMSKCLWGISRKCSMTPLTKCLPYVHVGTFETLQAGRHVSNIWNSWFVGSLVFNPSSRKLPGWCLEVSTWSKSLENRWSTNSATVTRSLTPTPPSKQTP